LISLVCILLINIELFYTISKLWSLCFIYPINAYTLSYFLVTCGFIIFVFEFIKFIYGVTFKLYSFKSFRLGDKIGCILYKSSSICSLELLWTLYLSAIYRYSAIVMSFFWLDLFTFVLTLMLGNDSTLLDSFNPDYICGNLSYKSVSNDFKVVSISAFDWVTGFFYFILDIEVFWEFLVEWWLLKSWDFITKSSRNTGFRLTSWLPKEFLSNKGIIRRWDPSYWGFFLFCWLFWFISL
jgi:hypothetical protein